MTSAYGTDNIWDVFDDSIVRFVGPDGAWITYGIDPCPHDEPLFGVTGWNPGEERPLADNEAANKRLAQHLSERSVTFTDAAGEASDGSWREPGFVLINTDEATALQIAVAFGQLAIHKMVNGKLVVVRTGISNR